MIVKLIVTQASGGCKEDAGGALRDPETERPRQTRVVWIERPRSCEQVRQMVAVGGGVLQKDTGHSDFAHCWLLASICYILLLVLVKHEKSACASQVYTSTDIRVSTCLILSIIYPICVPSGVIPSRAFQCVAGPVCFGELGPGIGLGHWRELGSNYRPLILISGPFGKLPFKGGHGAGAWHSDIHSTFCWQDPKAAKVTCTNLVYVKIIYIYCIV